MNHATNKFIKHYRPESSMAFLDPVFNPVLGPLLNWSPFWGIVVLSLIITVLVTLVYKYTTNQSEMKRLKDQQKEFQKKMKELKEQPEEMMKIQKEAMSQNLEYMKHSFKATLITMLPIILIFGWMAAHLSYEPIYPGEQYSITASFKGVTAVQLIVDNNTEILNGANQSVQDNKATWNLKSSEGQHLLTVSTGTTEQNKKVLITKTLNAEDAITTYANSDITQIMINYQQLRPLGHNFTVPLFNWQPGWLGIYIILSILFSIGLRKILNVY